MAHAHHPGVKIGGDIHFNADVNWKLKPCDDIKGDFEMIPNKIRYFYSVGSLKLNTNIEIRFIFNRRLLFKICCSA